MVPFLCPFQHSCLGDRKGREYSPRSKCLCGRCRCSSWSLRCLVMDRTRLLDDVLPNRGSERYLYRHILGNLQSGWPGWFCGCIRGKFQVESKLGCQAFHFQAHTSCRRDQVRFSPPSKMLINTNLFGISWERNVREYHDNRRKKYIELTGHFIDCLPGPQLYRDCPYNVHG